MASQPVLSLDGVSKRFGATAALSGVSLELEPGEVHALVGENGAGKSTLIKIMTGIYQPDEGTVGVDGEQVAIRGAADAQRLGLAAIYQEPLIFPDLSVAENIYIGHRDQRRIVRWRQLYRQAEEVLAKLDVQLDPRIPASGLTVAQQQAVEIAKAMTMDVRVLIMDEPTASLSAHEVDRLFRQVRALRDAGVAVLFVSHRLDEVFEIADRITVFRDGQHISTRPRNDVTEASLIAEMVGRELGALFVREQAAGERVDEIGLAPSEPVLRVHGLSKAGRFRDVSFEVQAGEVLGFAGLVGAGRTDIGLALFGITPADSGSVELHGETASLRHAQDALRQGIAYVSEDRRQLGLSMPQSITANITLPSLRSYRSRAGLMDGKAERATAEKYRRQLNIRATSLSQPVGLLSGGNQQKTMLAKWMNTSPDVLILDEPTRGIDVATKADVHRLIDDLARSGIAIILISSDLPEVLALSDRVLVMREGQQMGEFPRAEATEERIMTMAVGSHA